MAINVVYNPVEAMGALAVGAGDAEFRRRKQQEDAQLALQIQQENARRQANAIQTALQYDKLDADRQRQEASIAAQKASDAARLQFQKEQAAAGIAQDAAELDFRRGQAEQKVAREDERSAAVDSLIGQALPDADQQQKARLLYKATGRLPEELLIPRPAQVTETNAALNLQRQAAPLANYLKNAYDEFGNLKQGFDEATVSSIRQQYENLLKSGVSQPAPAPQQQQQQSVTPVPKPSIPPQAARQRALQILNANPVARLTFDLVVKDMYYSGGYSDMMTFQQFQQQLAGQLGKRGVLDAQNARVFLQQAGGDENQARALALASGWIF